MNEDLMSLPGIESALNRLAKVFEPSSQIVKKVFTRSGQLDGGEKKFEPRLLVEVFFVPYPLGVYLLREAFELYEADPDSHHDVKILNINHDWEAQEYGLAAYRRLEVNLGDRVYHLHELMKEGHNPKEESDIAF